MSSKEYHKQYDRERKEWLKKHHLCVQCKEQDERTLRGMCLCAKCAVKQQERERKRIMEVKE